MEGFANVQNFSYAQRPLDKRTNTNFWLSLYNPQEAQNLSPEQKKFLQDMTGQEGHRVTRLDSYTDNSSAQARFEKIKQEALETGKAIETWKPNMFSRTPPEQIDVAKEIQKLITSLEDDKKNIDIADSLFTKTTDKPMTVYRRINTDTSRNFGQNFLNDLEQNRVMRNSNLLSTSTNKNMISDWGGSTILQIEVPTGTRYFVNPLSKAGKIDSSLGFELPKHFDGVGYGEDEIIFPRESGLKIDPIHTDANIHQSSGVYAGDKPQNVKVYKARFVSPESGQPDRLTGEIESQLKFLNQELEKINPKSVKGKDVAGKVTNVVGKASAAFDPVGEVASQVLPRAASAAGLGAEVAMGAAMIPLAVGAFTQQAGDPMGDFKASFAPGEFEKWQERQEESRKKQNTSAIQSVIDRPYDPNQASPRRRQNGR